MRLRPRRRRAAALALTALAYLPAGAAQWPAHGPSAGVIVSVLVLAALCTAVAVVLGVLFLHEPLTWGIVLGFGLILAGSVLATRRSRGTTTPAGPVALQPR